MNTQTYTMDIGVDTGEVEDVCLCLLHTILFHRTQGKFSFLQPEGTFSIGTVGYRDTECQSLDFVFVQNDSSELDRHVRKEISSLLQEMHRTQGLRALELNLEFYEKKRAIWLFATEQIPWELWSIKLQIISLPSEADRRLHKESLCEALKERIIEVGQIISRFQYIPKNPRRDDLASIFDTSYSTLQPYLHKITFSIEGNQDPTVGTAVMKLLTNLANS